MNKIFSFLREVRLELKKVTWPSKNDIIKHTLLVIGISLVVALFLGAMDLIFTWVLNKFVI